MIRSKYLLLAAIAAPVITLLWSLTIAAQPLCFLQTSDGSVIDLTDSFCPDTASELEPSVPASGFFANSETLPAATVNFLVGAYADGYCEAKAMGLPENEVLSLAESAMFESSVDQFGLFNAPEVVGRMSTENWDTASATAASRCPN